MQLPPAPSFTEEHGLFYLWKAEPQADLMQLAGEYKTESELQQRSLEIFGIKAAQRVAP